MAPVERTKGTRKLMYQRRTKRMEETGRCPDCRGRGRTRAVIHEFYYEPAKDCSACGGDGSYRSWQQRKKKA
ncbi:hypothetical protein [Alkalicoccus chagannorensis]|uniref:hypothetical protein n=1 Tax=Alkalicoccus chagannorensis TaxID=427072 RepID=UPI0003F6ED9F|nr:hypothetical protein [Alkalicoccus chagannorensis]